MSHAASRFPQSKCTARRDPRIPRRELTLRYQGYAAAGQAAGGMDRLWKAAPRLSTVGPHRLGKLLRTFPQPSPLRTTFPQPSPLRGAACAQLRRRWERGAQLVCPGRVPLAHAHGGHSENRSV
jgi:hypothetical protein